MTGYYYDERYTILETTNNCKLRIAANDYLMNPSEGSYFYYFYQWGLNEQLSYKDSPPPPAPHI